MKAKCPKNLNHEEFITTVYVSEEWVVDENGEYLRICEDQRDSQVLHKPNPNNFWYCAMCGEIAEVR